MFDYQQSGPQSFWQMGNPFLNVMLETEVPGLVFQPWKAMALGQIATVSLINRRMKACSEMPYRLASCRSPQQLMQEQMRFFQVALRDYADAVNQVSEAWSKAVAAQDGANGAKRPRHDYLSISEAADQMPEREHASNGAGTTSALHRTAERTRPGV